MQILQQHGEQLLNELPNDELQGTNLIDQVVKFVNENFMLDIGIGQIAEGVEYHPQLSQHAFS